MEVIQNEAVTDERFKFSHARRVAWRAQNFTPSYDRGRSPFRTIPLSKYDRK